jgi:hypothetical protein
MTLEDQAPPAQASEIDARERDALTTFVVPLVRELLSYAVRRGDVELARNLTAKAVRAVMHGVATSPAPDERRLLIREVWF